MEKKEIKEILWGIGRGRCMEILGWRPLSFGMPWGGIAQAVRYTDGTECRECGTLETIEKSLE